MSGDIGSTQAQLKSKHIGYTVLFRRKGLEQTRPAFSPLMAARFEPLLEVLPTEDKAQMVVEFYLRTSPLSDQSRFNNAEGLVKPIDTLELCAWLVNGPAILEMQSATSFRKLLRQFAIRYSLEFYSFNPWQSLGFGKDIYQMVTIMNACRPDIAKMAGIPAVKKHPTGDSRGEL